MGVFGSTCKWNDLVVDMAKRNNRNLVESIIRRLKKDGKLSFASLTLLRECLVELVLKATRYVQEDRMGILEGSIIEEEYPILSAMLLEIVLAVCFAVCFIQLYEGQAIAPVAIIDHQLPLEYTIASRSIDVMVPIPPAPHDDSKYLRSGMRYMMLIMRLLLLFLEKGKPVGPYVIKMKNYVAQLERLGYVLPQDLSVGLILNGLTSDFARFVRNYNIHNMGKAIGELHALLIEYKIGLPKKAATPQVMAIQGGRIQKANKKPLNTKCNG
ncbi:hypothetical protein Tco_0429620 [Tanacetum coccineum]